MKEIELTQGKVAVVDDCDFEFLNQWTWTALLCNGKFWYAKRGNGIYMHRVVSGAGPRAVTDHRDGDTLNNRRYNLRVTTYSGNAQNRDKNRKSASLFKGVHFNKRAGKFAVRCKRKHFGYFSDPQEAALAYDAAAIALCGPFARTNKMLGLLCQ